jgi:hypothetical protein
MPKNSKKNDKETAASTEPVVPQPPPKPTIADLGEQHFDAQQKFERATNQANLEAYKTLLAAYRDYATELYDAQQEFEEYAFEAYQNYLAKLAQISGSEVGQEAGTAQYWEFVRLTTALAGEGGWRGSVEKAYHELLNTFVSTESQPDSLLRQTAAYRTYVEQLTAAWKQAEPIQRQAEQAYMAYAKDQKDGFTKEQTAFESAYQDYLKDLNQAYVRSNLEQRTAVATSNYLTKAEESSKHSQTIYADAAKGLSETQENLVRGLQP